MTSIEILQSLFQTGLDFQISTAHDVMDWSLGNPFDGIIATGSGDSVDDAIRQLAEAAATAWPGTEFEQKYRSAKQVAVKTHRLSINIVSIDRKKKAS